MPQKIICFDLDGTLIDTHGMIHPADIEILATHRTDLLVPSTGRTISSVRQIFTRNGLFIGRPIPIPLILQNGAALYSEDEHLLAHHCFKEDTQAKLIQLLPGFQQVSFLLLGLDVIYTLHENDFSREATASFDFLTQPFIKSGHSLKLSKVMCLADNPVLLEAVSASVKPLPVESYYSLTFALEICPQGVNKANGILQLINFLGIEDYLLYAVGDGENDLPMLDLAHFSYVPSTARDRIRASVNHTIDASKNGILAPILDGYLSDP